MEPQLYVGLDPIVKTFDFDDCFFSKPVGGLWTSTYIPSSGSEWVQFCLGESLHLPHDNKWNSFILIPREDARIFTVDSFTDCKYLFDNYGIIVPYKSNFITEPSTRKRLDFEKIILDYDAIHITQNGFLSTKMTTPFSMYEWSCESTVWFRDVFTSITNIGLMEFNEIDDCE